MELFPGPFNQSRMAEKGRTCSFRGRRSCFVPQATARSDAPRTMPAIFGRLSEYRSVMRRFVRLFLAEWLGQTPGCAIPGIVFGGNAGYHPRCRLGILTRRSGRVL